MIGGLDEYKWHIAISVILIVLVIYTIFSGIEILGLGRGGNPGKAAAECSDRLDNDGDGLVDLADPGCSDKKDSDETNCGDGICEGGESPSCLQDCCSAQPEVCDNSDNDCDGLVDENVMRQCGTTDIGFCRLGTQSCTAGVWGGCNGAIEPEAEACDGLDNDCDGSIDENVTKQCGSSELGECSFGTQSCLEGAWLVCVGQVDPATEACDGLDNDCDGVIDDGCDCVEGSSQQCGTDTGECSFGSQTCSGGQWGACVGGTGPSTEACDGLDNDCDGFIDENVCGNGSG